jgi:hypothetical protein
MEYRCVDIRCRWGTGVSTVLRTGGGVAARTSHFLLVLQVQQTRRCRHSYEEGAPVVSRIGEKAAVGACRGVSVGHIKEAFRRSILWPALLWGAVYLKIILPNPIVVFFVPMYYSPCLSSLFLKG